MARKPRQRPGEPLVDDGKPTTEVSAWLSAITRAKNDQQKYNERCDKIRDRYAYDQAKQVKRRKFQLFWSNIEVLKPAVYAKPPKPVVEDRWKTGNPIAQLAGQILERNLIFQNDAMRWGDTFTTVRDEFLLYARGLPRLLYCPVIEVADVETGLGNPDEAGAYADEQQTTQDLADPEGDDPGGINEDPEVEPTPPSAVLQVENIKVSYVYRKDWITPKSRSWEELPWMVFRSFLTRAECVARFPDPDPITGKPMGQMIPLDGTMSRRADEKDRAESLEDKAIIYEIWDRANNEVLWLAEGYQHVLEKGPPYLKFSGFWPCPKPAFGTLTTDSIIPIPDIVFYQDQLEEIDELTARIGALTDSLKLVGFYAAGPDGKGNPQIEMAVKPGFENKMIAVASWAAFKEGGGAKGAVEWLPVEMVAMIIKECVETRKQLVDDVYQITGISDIMRGLSEASETLGAQKLKSQFGSARMRDRQRTIAQLCADVVMMAGEVMCEIFSIEGMLAVADMKLPTKAMVAQAQMEAQLAQRNWQQQSLQAQQTGSPPPPSPPQVPDFGPTVEDIEQFFRNEAAVKMRVDIEVDSTINADEEAEKQSRAEFLTATSQFVGAWGPMIAQSPDLAPLAGELMLFGARAFRSARSLEGVIEQWVKGMEQKAANPQPPQPTPEQQLAQAKLEQAKADGQNSQQLHQATMEQQDQKHQQAMEQAQLQHGAKMDEIRTQGAIAVAKEHIAGAREKQSHGLAMAKEGAAMHGVQLNHKLTQDAANSDENRKQGSAKFDADLKHETATRDDMRKRDGANADEARKHAGANADEERKGKAAARDDELKAKAEARAAKAKPAGEKADSAIADKIAELQAEIRELKASGGARRIKITGRGPDGRMSEAEVS